MALTIILFDMDGVLLEAHGYHRALQETVKLISQGLGFNSFLLTPDQIAKFEASGVTNEWDTAAICAALLLIQAWKFDPTVSLPEKLCDLKVRDQGLMAPEIDSFIQTIHLQGNQVLEFAEQSLVDNGDSLNRTQKEVIRNLLRNGREISKSLTKRIFQELVLGSKQFETSYKKQARLDVQSYLTQFDKAVLNSNSLRLLTDWLDEKEHSASIFTNRPDNSMNDFFGTPEAENGALLVGLEQLPIMGSGSLSWAAQKHNSGGPLHLYFKPSAVHSLSALQLALGASLDQALSNSISLADGNGSQQDWFDLDRAHVFVVEDTSGGFKSALAAKNLLKELGIELQITLLGIAEHSAKAQALRETGADVFENVNLSLQRIFDDYNYGKSENRKLKKEIN